MLLKFGAVSSVDVGNQAKRYKQAGATRPPAATFVPFRQKRIPALHHKPSPQNIAETVYSDRTPAANKTHLQAAERENRVPGSPAPSHFAPRNPFYFFFPSMQQQQRLLISTGSRAIVTH